MLRSALVLVLAGLATLYAAAPATIFLPVRPAEAMGGAEFSRRIADLDLPSRERLVLAEVERGNVPEFWRRFVEVKVIETSGDRTDTAIYRVSPDYFAIGSDQDYFLTPITPMTAQTIGDRLQCTLPTRKMVDDIYRVAEVKLTPIRIPPTPAMTTAPVFAQHNESVRAQRGETLAAHPLGSLVAGDKKDIVQTPLLAAAPGKVAIYGWHQPDGRAIQALYTGHTNHWVDYSHGARFVAREMQVNGAATTVDAVLADATLGRLLSDEGAFQKAQGATPAPAPEAAAAPLKAAPGEENQVLQFEPGVRVLINSPAGAAFDAKKPVRLVLYALPNGNTIEQTIGHRLKPGEDWHFDIQHIGAQTRWLRERLNDSNLAVAYLETSVKSWPAWRGKNDPDGQRIARIVETLRGRFDKQTVKLVLTGHSGGGSFTFGFLNAVERIPDWVERFAFLDSDYAYDAALHHDTKLAQWLSASPQHSLCVLAYHDSIALLNGKTFVSEKGGTWGRSLAMQQDLAGHFSFTSETAGDWRRFAALDGRVKFFLHENPEKAILHTRQVERNGFIHAMLTGTEREEKDYTYFGERAYEALVVPE